MTQAEKFALIQQRSSTLTRRVDAFKDAQESGDINLIRDEFTAMIASNELCKEALTAVVDEGDEG